MTVTIRPLDAAAVTHVCAHMRAMDCAEIFATRPDDDVHAVAAATMALARFGGVAWWNDEPVAVACAMPLWPGVWSVGMYATDLWPHVAHATTRWIGARLMPDLLDAGAHRAECRSLATHVTAHRWLERLGATREAALADCGRNRETFYLYAWTLTENRRTIDVLRTFRAAARTTAATAGADSRQQRRRAERGQCRTPTSAEGARTRGNDPDRSAG